MSMKRRLINYFGRARKAVFVASALTMSATLAFAQVQTKVSGKVVDANGQPLPGVAIMIQGGAGGTVTDFDGNYTLNVPEGSVLSFSFIGFENKTVTVGAGANYNVTMEDDSKELEEVVVVGYGQQKKASVVGAITQTTGEVLERAAGISDIGAALTGNLPGVITFQSSGMPGEETPNIVIRGASSPNGSDPLVLVDGVERPMATVDMSSVATISVLKDASATAVYGVKGANGVILITTKRGQEGKAQVNVSAEAIMKMVSKLPGKLDSYDALMKRNMAIEHELNINSSAWDMVNSQEFIDQYRNQTTQEQKDRFPNIDWQDELFRKRAMAYKANVNVMGGTKFVSYFASADYNREGDLFKQFDSDRGYKAGFGFDKISIRSNLDFKLTPTTTFKTNIAGSTGIQKTNFGGISAINDWGLAQKWAGVYNIAPDVFQVKYADGTWGYYPGKSNVTNSAENIALGGVTKTVTTRITSDFVLDQDFKFLLEGLKFHGSISWDNNFQSSAYEINDLYHDAQHTWIDPYTGKVSHSAPNEKYNSFDYAAGVKWNAQGGSLNNVERLLNYELQLFYANKFGDHNVSAMGVFKREEKYNSNTEPWTYMKGFSIPVYRQDYVYRFTYDYASKYNFEYNGAYNGSEKFAKDLRMALFHSGAIGWTISEENFMALLRERKIIDMLKIRASYGQIGDDSGTPRFAFKSDWEYNGGAHAMMTETSGPSPYAFYREKTVGNEKVQWETVNKFNIGVDYSFLDNMFAGSVDFFKDRRTDVFINGDKRAIPSYFGQDPVSANLGEIENKGYEIEVRFNKVLASGLRLWANANYTHAENKITKWEDPQLLASYRKTEGYAIDQRRTLVSAGFLQTYDDIYGSPKYDTKNEERLPGDFYVVDFNGDGVVDSNDNTPWGFTGVPENTYSISLGAEWRGWSANMQFYGVSNVTRDVNLTSFGNQLNNVYDTGTWWSENHTGAEKVTPRWGTNIYTTGTQDLYDGSYFRLKNVEIAYTFKKIETSKIAFKDVKLFIGGNNLWVWTKMPDDRESNFAGASNQGQYPTVKRVNFGVKFSL